jgi:signal transduction histidine kinase
MRHNAGVVAGLGRDDPERLRRLQQLTDAALANLKLQELLDTLLERTKEMLDADTAAVLLLEESTQELVARAAVGIEEEVERGVRIPLGRGLAGRIAAERRPIVLADVDHADVLNPVLREKGVKSILGVPLVVGGKLIGVLHVGSLTPRVFGPDDVALLQLAGDRAAIGIEHARLFASERDARIRLERLQAVTDAALSQLNLEDLLAVLLPRIREILSADTCAVLLVDERGRELVARAAVGIEEEVERGVRIPIGGGFAGRVAAQRRPVVLGRVDEAHVLNPILLEKGIKSLLGVPLLLRDEVLGVLHVGTLVPRVFTTDDVELLQLVAERVALAIERARLHEEMVTLDQLKLNFVAIASHELRTPATAVYGVLATLVERGHELSDDVRETLLLAGYEQGERLRVLLEDLLDLSRLDAAAINVEPKPVVLHTLVEGLARKAVPLGTDVDVRVAPDLAAVADPTVIDRVLSNLLLNAVVHGQPPITVYAEQRDRHVRIAVEDCGTGVAPELRPRLFERFARGAEQAGGSGLGLAIARAYARAHGGDLVYDPRDGGARFELLLPQG